jgi:K+-sensing histidine kinase KdpD
VAIPVRFTQVTSIASHTPAMTDEQGHLKVFIGMAPGVGKTYRMLQEGVAEADSGRDVVIGYLESHGRAETLAQAEGLELVPRRRLSYRGTPLEELDLPAVLARRPELCLIDELAHTNAPGVEHEKRFEDVREVIDAGIDVQAPGGAAPPDGDAGGAPARRGGRGRGGGGPLALGAG